MTRVECPACQGSGQVTNFRAERISCEICHTTGKVMDPLKAENWQLREQNRALTAVLEIYRQADIARADKLMPRAGFRKWGDDE